MKLRFLPRGDASPLVPFAPMAVGQPAKRIGRKFNPETGNHDLPGDPFECEPGSQAAARCLKFLRRGDVVPADAETAKFLGIAFDKPAETEKPSRGRKDS